MNHPDGLTLDRLDSAMGVSRAERHNPHDGAPIPGHRIDPGEAITAAKVATEWSTEKNRYFGEMVNDLDKAFGRRETGELLGLINAAAWLIIYRDDQIWSDTAGDAYRGVEEFVAAMRAHPMVEKES